METTGLNPNTCNILEFAAVVDDLKVQAPIESLPKFQSYIIQDVYSGEPYALSMHAEIFKKLSNWKKSGINVCVASCLMLSFHTFLNTIAGYACTNGDFLIKINVAGKNFNSFDLRFIEKLPNFDNGVNTLVKFHHRVLDPAILYFNPIEDETLPSTEVCMMRAGINGPVAHTALEDAITVIKLIRNKFPKNH